MKLTWILRLVVAALALVLLAPASIAGAGAGEKKEEKGKTFVGTVEGTDAYIGIVVGKKGAFGYICDGEAITHWLHGAVKKGEVTLGAQTGAAVVAELADGALTGTVILPTDPSAPDLEGQLASVTSHAFEATRAKGDAGLFRQEEDAEGATFAAGWVVLEDGSLRGEVTVARVAGDTTTTTTQGATTTTAPAATTTAPVPVTPSQTAPTTTPPATTAPPGTTSPGNPGGVVADVGTNAVGQIAPPNIQMLFPPTPFSADAVTKAPKPTRACIIATAQYNLAIKQWKDAGTPGSGPTYDRAIAAGTNFEKACGLGDFAA